MGSQSIGTIMCTEEPRFHLNRTTYRYGVGKGPYKINMYNCGVRR